MNTSIIVAVWGALILSAVWDTAGKRGLSLAWLLFAIGAVIVAFFMRHAD